MSGYRGTVMQGIGMTKSGNYPRKLADEMGLTRKRAFDKGQHGLSKGFEELAMPSNIEALMIEFNEKRSQQMADDHRNKVAHMSQTYQSQNGGP